MLNRSAAFCLVFLSAVVTVTKSPAAEEAIDFRTQIKPILQGKCFKCHGPTKQKSRYRMDNRAAALKGGADGVAIIPGNGLRKRAVSRVLSI